MGWGAEAFLKDWDEVVRVQNQPTLDGSPVAQAIIKLMEEHGRCSEGSLPNMHAMLREHRRRAGRGRVQGQGVAQVGAVAVEAHQGGVPLLVAAGIEAGRAEDRSGARKITLRKMPKNDATNATVEANPAQIRRNLVVTR